jgi:hypothetical protein
MGVKPSINDQVAAIMDLYPPARSDNNLLVALYWQVCDGVEMTGDLANRIAQATSVESIVRARREVLQQDAEQVDAVNIIQQIRDSMKGEGAYGDET